MERELFESLVMKLKVQCEKKVKVVKEWGRNGSLKSGRRFGSGFSLDG